MSKVEMDSRGRIVIPKEYRTGQKEYHIVRFKDSIRLFPVSENPLEDLREMTGSLREDDRTPKEMQKDAREAIRQEAGE